MGFGQRNENDGKNYASDYQVGEFPEEYRASEPEASKADERFIPERKRLDVYMLFLAVLLLKGGRDFSPR